MVKRAWILLKHTYQSFNQDDCLQLSAAIAYYILFSMLPLLIFTVSVFGFFLTNQDLRSSLIDHILDFIPLSSTDGRRSLDNALSSVHSASSIGAVIGLLATAWTASAVFASVRKSLNRVWGTREQRPFFGQKMVDLLQVGLIGMMLIASVAATAVLRILRSNAPGGIHAVSGQSPVWEVPAILLPSVLTIGVFLLLYRLVPTARPRWRDIIPGALVGTLLFEVLKNTFAIYVAHFNNFSVVYGSLAAVFLFLIYMYLTAAIILFGAELSHALQRYHAGEFQLEIAPLEPQPPVAARMARAFKGLFVRQH